MQDIDLGEETGSTVEEEQAVDQGQDMEETTKEETKKEPSKREAPDSGLRGSRRLKQRLRQNYSDMVFGNAADCDGEHFWTLAFSTGSEEVSHMMKIADQIPKGPEEPNIVTEALEGLDSDRWKESIAEKSNDLWKKGTFSFTTEGTVPV